MEGVIFAILLIIIAGAQARQNTKLKERIFELHQEFRIGKWDHERDWEKYPPPKWVFNNQRIKKPVVRMPDGTEKSVWDYLTTKSR